jgi:hypothetical protein
MKKLIVAGILSLTALSVSAKEITLLCIESKSSKETFSSVDPTSNRGSWYGHSYNVGKTSEEYILDTADTLSVRINRSNLKYKILWSAIDRLNPEIIATGQCKVVQINNKI